jgi:hypothetical protein
MPLQTSVKVSYSAKTVIPITSLKDVRSWLLANCKQRWYATDFKGAPFNWRRAGKMSPEMQKYFSDMDITFMVHFNQAEDLMLYLLTWPSDVLLNP